MREDGELPPLTVPGGATQALDCCHARGVMHRDVKPQNIVVDPARRTLCLLDWGLADFCCSGRAYSTDVATRSYRAPELLVGVCAYGCAVDLWAFGCVLAGAVFRYHQFFRSRTDAGLLMQIVRVLGTADYVAFLDRHGVACDAPVRAVATRCTAPLANFSCCAPPRL